ncbi:MAG: HugZ family protein [Marinicella sp.]
MNKKNKAIKEARTLLRSQERAMLSTHSFSKSGYPFGSVTTYMTDHQGHPIIYISHLAQHTKNIKHDCKISLLVNQENEGDINSGARLTLLGRAEPILDNEFKSIAEKFFLKFPESRKYQDTHDFNFYRIKVEHVRYIGGFGQIYWLDHNQFILPVPNWLENEQPAIDHMNVDHTDAMQLMCSYYKSYEADEICMTHLYPDGCALRANQKHNYFLAFQELVESPKDIRIRLVELTKEARVNSIS